MMVDLLLRAAVLALLLLQAGLIALGVWMLFQPPWIVPVVGASTVLANTVIAWLNLGSLRRL